MAAKTKSALIIGGSIAAVIVVVVIIAVKPGNTQYPLGYNPALYPAGFIPPNQTDKGALYTGISSVINKSIETFFGDKKTTTTQPGETA